MQSTQTRATLTRARARLLLAGVSEAQVDALMAQRRCISCGTYYFEFAALGALACRQHPLPFNELHDGPRFPRGTYECCGRRPIHIPGHNGCTRCDHHETPWQPDETTPVLAGLHKVLEGIVPSVTLERMRAASPGRTVHIARIAPSPKNVK